MMLTARDLAGYDESLERVATAAGESAERAYDAMRAANLNATVADVRESLIDLIESIASRYGDAASEVAASLYDAMAKGAGANVGPAELADEPQDGGSTIDRRVRYLVRELAETPGRDDI